MRNECRLAGRAKQEVAALHSMGAKVRSRYYVDGGLFNIYQSGEHLEAVIDRYSAVCPEAHTPAFNVDTWEQLKIRLQAPCSRAGFLLLRRICRSLLSAQNAVVRTASGSFSLSLQGAAVVRRHSDSRRCPVLYPYALGALAFSGMEARHA